MREEIQNILDKDKLYNLTRKNYLEKNYKTIYDNLYMFKNIYYFNIELPFAQLVYLYSYDLKELPVCLKCNSNKLTFVSFSQGYKKYCSKKCSNNHQERIDKRNQTILKKYGVKNISQSEIIKEKKRKNSIEKHGVDSPLKLKEIRDKCEATCVLKYGDYNVSKVKELYNKQRIKYQKTLKDKYGVDHISKVKSVQESKEKTYLKNWGVKNPFLSKIIQDKKNNTIQERYGVNNVGKLLATIDKREKTYLEKYGVKNPMLLYKPVKTSKIETKICKLINGEKFRFQGREYDIKVGKDIFEIDGDYFHPKEKKNLGIMQMGGLINDYRKYNAIVGSEYNIYKIYTSNLPKNLEGLTIDLLKQLSYEPNYQINYEDVLISSDYLKKYVKEKGENKLFKYVFKQLVDICIEIGKLNLTKEEIEERVRYILLNKLDFSFNNILNNSYFKINK